MSHVDAEVATNRIEKFGSEQEAARAELIDGLSRPQARIAPKYFYDALGSKLFEAICQLDEYYLTRTEAAIFARSCAPEIAERWGREATLIDLGAGNCAKAARTVSRLAAPGLLRSRRYFRGVFARRGGGAEKILSAHPDASRRPRFFRCFGPARARAGRGARNCFFIPALRSATSTPLQAAKFLTRIRAACGERGGALLLGIDLVKPAEELEAAYDDALGVTAAFNLNALRHINRLLGSDFLLRDWQHKACSTRRRAGLRCICAPAGTSP